MVKESGNRGYLQMKLFSREKENMVHAVETAWCCRERLSMRVQHSWPDES